MSSQAFDVTSSAREPGNTQGLSQKQSDKGLIVRVAGSYSGKSWRYDSNKRERERERERGRERERKRERERERQRDRETERERDRETERQRGRETERQRDTVWCRRGEVS